MTLHTSWLHKGLFMISRASAPRFLSCGVNPLRTAQLSGQRANDQGSSVCVRSVAQLCLFLCDPLDCSPPGSSVHGSLQARILEWVTISISRGASWPRNWICVSWVSCIGRQILYHCTPWKLSPNAEFSPLATAVHSCFPPDGVSVGLNCSPCGRVTPMDSCNRR